MNKLFYILILFIQVSLPLFPGKLFSQDTKVFYTVGMPFPSNHLFEVVISVKNYSPVQDGYADFILPAWRSGRYAVLNFSSGVQEFSAEEDNGKKLTWNKIDKNTWRVQNNNSLNFKVKYKVYANEFNLRTRGLNDERAFIDASAVLMYPEKLRHSPLEINIIPYKDWHVTTGLGNLNGSENIFSSKDYDYLADCPIVIGKQKDFDFFVNGKKHTVSFSGDGNYNTDSVVKDISKIVKTVSDFWGDNPYEHFTFLLMASTQEFGATEHLNSTVIDFHPLIFLNKDFYNNFLSNAAHEFFHTWNVKRLRPKGLDPYDFTKENYTSELWIAEGITSYYQNIFLLRAGFINPEKYFDIITNNIRNDLERPGNYVQTLAESGFDAWVKYNNNTQNKWIAESDYYGKGTNVGLLLDLAIRHNSENKYSLDDVMRKMYKDFPLEKGGYTNEDFVKMSEEFGGIELKNFFDAYLYGLDTLDWKKYLDYAELDFKITYDPEKPSLGVSTRESGDRLYVSYVTPGSAAYEAGLDINDEIIALNGYRVRSANLNTRISDMKDGDNVKLTIMREDKLREFELQLKGYKTAKYKIDKNPEPDKLQEKIYRDWLHDS